MPILNNAADSDESNSNSSTEAAPRTTRHSVSRLAKKSTSTPPEPTRKQIVRRQGTRQATQAIANKEKERLKQSQVQQVEKRKALARGQIYDHRGIHINTGRDLCDCLELACPGCFYPCKRCGTSKCGFECRINRKMKIESIEFHGYNYVRRNPLDRP